MKIKQFDMVLLKDGRTGVVVEVNKGDSVDIDVGSSSSDCEILYYVPISEIEKVIEPKSSKP